MRDRAWTGVLVMVALACSVDNRSLRLGTSAGATGVGASDAAGTHTGSPSGGDAAAPARGGAAGAASEVNAAGESSTPPPLPPLVDGCADLDTDSVPDCSVTLVENAAFDRDVSGWSAVGTSSLAWADRNALADTPSGCALLSAEGRSDIDGTALFRASQCVRVPAGQLVIAYANARVEASAAGGDAAQAELQVSFFDREGCVDKSNGYFTTPPSTAVGEWVTIQAGGVSGSATKSALVELVGVKPYRADSLSACFDNVMLKAKAL